MGGFWTQPIKLLDGLWFGLDGNWLGKDVAAAKYTSGHGYSRIDYSGSVDVRRTDFVPDGIRATLVGLTLSSSTAKTVKLAVDAHSELMQSYPWGWTAPGAADANLPDTGAYANGALRLPRAGHTVVPERDRPRLRRVRRIVPASDGPRARPEPPRPAGPGGDLPGRRYDARTL